MRALIGCMVLCGCLSAFDATIPVLDMQDYRDMDRREEFVRKVGEAIREVGFFALRNSGIDQDVLDAAYDETREFYHLPFEEKMRWHDRENNGMRGFVPGEAAKGMAVKDFKEYVHVGPELSDEEIMKRGIPKNIWLDRDAYKESMLSLYEAVGQLMIPLREVLAEAIGQPKNAFDWMTSEGNNVLRSIYYPANPPKGTIWAAAHTDIDLFTILPRATAKGLQMKNKAGEWITVVKPDDAVVINAGDMLEHLSNGEVRAGPHRVMALGEGYERISMVFFVNPALGADLTPNEIALSRTGGEAKRAAGTAWEVFAERIVENGLASDAMKKRLGESGYLERQLKIGRASFEAMQIVADSGYASSEVLEALANQS